MKNLRAFLAIAISLMFAACAATSPAPVSEEHLARREGYRRATLPPRRIGPASAQNGGKANFAGRNRLFRAREFQSSLCCRRDLLQLRSGNSRDGGDGR